MHKILYIRVTEKHIKVLMPQGGPTACTLQIPCAELMRVTLTIRIAQEQQLCPWVLQSIFACK